MQTTILSTATEVREFVQRRSVKLASWLTVGGSVQRCCGYTFLSDGWWSLILPSSSHLTIASASFACSTIPNSPVGLPKLPKPSTRSPGFSSCLVAEGWESGGLLARSESGVAPG